MSGTHLGFRKKDVVKSTNEVLLLTSNVDTRVLFHWGKGSFGISGPNHDFVWCCASFWGNWKRSESPTLLIHLLSNLLILKWWSWSDHQIDDLHVYRSVEKFLAFTCEEHREFWIVHLALHGTGRKKCHCQWNHFANMLVLFTAVCFCLASVVEQGKVFPGKHW